ncbi:MAG: hypothetical protein SFT93_00080, partial [Rickettsiaceae bacterium]|nr:hypothetical protein [Rickettsiaceae bacterium]
MSKFPTHIAKDPATKTKKTNHEAIESESSISPRTYAILAFDVYNKESGPLPDGWEVYKESRTQNDTYFGRAYLNKNSNEYIISHRGTDNFVNIADDVLLLAKQDP